MPAPHKVHQTKFPVDRVLYDDGDFAVAWGRYEDEREKRLGMRWNGGPNEVGYPCRGKYPVWFMLPDELTKPVVKALLETEAAKKQAILKVLKQLPPT
jgi:hypothetical protein